MSKIMLKPLGDRVIVEPINEAKSKSKSAILMPETINKERPEQGKVVAVGDGWYAADGTLIPLRVKKGQMVIFSKYGPDEIKFEDKEYFVIKELNILAIID